ncbi:MAG: cation diffusion facilitator family transporter [Coriobacteriales bacterium]|nr:cation diffusion facilitator family transporter [Coriobacteriales bacterium]
MKELFAKSKAIMAALCVNLTIAIMKFAVAIVSGSASLLSEAIHSAADTLNQIVLLIGKRAAARPANDRHPFGYARASFFASFLVASLLFFVGGAFSLLEAVEKIGHIGDGAATHEQTSFIIAAVILVISIGLEAFSFRTALKEVAEQQAHDGTHMSVPRFFRETSNSSLIVVMTEDLAAMLGLMLALAGVVLTLVTGNLLFDALGGAAIGVLLIVAAAVLGKETASLIIGEALPAEKVTAIRTLVEDTEKVAGCRMIKTVAIGTDSLLVEVDVAFAEDGSVSAEQVLTAIVSIKADIHALLEHDAQFINTCIEPVSPTAPLDREG